MGGQAILYWRGIGFIQYWRSFEDVERFARSPSEPHLDTWRNFNQTIGADGTVGIWHETYMVEPGGQARSGLRQYANFRVGSGGKAHPSHRAPRNRSPTLRR